jgi:hypothetical protein
MRIKNDAAARLDEVFEELRRAIFAAYTALVEHNRDREVTMGSPSGLRRMSEQERRQSSLEFIDEVLDRHPLASFSAVHLELLELMMAYWREAEVEAGAPSPDPLH